MSTPRYTGTLTYWNAADGFGEVTMAGHAPLVCYRDELRSAGVAEPSLGMALSFAIGATYGGLTGAISIEKVK